MRPIFTFLLALTLPSAGAAQQFIGFAAVPRLGRSIPDYSYAHGWLCRPVADVQDCDLTESLTSEAKLTFTEDGTLVAVYAAFTVAQPLSTQTLQRRVESFLANTVGPDLTPVPEVWQSDDSDLVALMAGHYPGKARYRVGRARDGRRYAYVIAVECLTPACADARPAR